VAFKARKGTLGGGPNEQAVDQTVLDRVVPKGQLRGEELLRERSDPAQP
jgi:hypothetical protein